MVEAVSLDTLRTMNTCVIARRGDFERLLAGFRRLKAISYVASPDLLLELLEERGYAEVEVLVGDSLAQHYREVLREKGLGITERLADRVESGALRIYVPPRTVHTKLYVLEGEGVTRVMLSSANLTETARQATRQINYAWYADLPTDHPWLWQVMEDYGKHLRGCSVFMGDLVELFRQNEGEPRQQLIEAWLRGAIAGETELETKKVLQEIAAHSLEHPRSHEEPVFAVRLPEAPQARRRAERMLAPLKPVIDNGQVQVNGPAFIRYVQESHDVPLMRVDLQRGDVRLGVNGSVRSCTEPLPDAQLVDSALEHIEAYIRMVERGQLSDPQFAGMSMVEALLYMFSAPFANEHMSIMRSRYGVLDTRGPRFLYVFGPSQNGKTTFFRFALKLLTGQNIQPFSGGDFTKRKVAGAAVVGTAFPLVFDDVIPYQSKSFEEILKSHWEVWWREEYVSPQIILSSNVESLKDWAKSRVKRVDFDVHFAPCESNKARLAEVFGVDNPIFKWFSYLYLQRLKNVTVPSDDELQLARAVMRELYEHARRPLPGFFPHEPIENLYDPGRRRWRDLVYRLGKAKLCSKKGGISLQFADDMQHHEIKEFQSYLPQTVKYHRRGKTLVVENPSEFKTWLDGPGADCDSWLARLRAALEGKPPRFWRRR